MAGVWKALVRAYASKNLNVHTRMAFSVCEFRSAISRNEEHARD
jgi:hypothetical protein